MIALIRRVPVPTLYTTSLLRRRGVIDAPPNRARRNMPGGASVDTPPRERGEGRSTPPLAFDMFVALTFAVFLVLLVSLGRWVKSEACTTQPPGLCRKLQQTTDDQLSALPPSPTRPPRCALRGQRERHSTNDPWGRSKNEGGLRGFLSAHTTRYEATVLPLRDGSILSRSLTRALSSHSFNSSLSSRPAPTNQHAKTTSPT